jgi:hypothetical protein
VKREAGDTANRDLPEFLAFTSALSAFARAVATQDQQHIKPIHHYLALRLVLEGGFRPDDITPQPPLRHVRRRGADFVEFESAAQEGAEATVLGGLKSKRVDLTVTKEGIGPVLCISVKGTGNAFRNLTNRMEEAIGDCTNLHMMYPGLVYGFLHLLKARHADEAGIARNDISINADGTPSEGITRYHDVLTGLAGRRLVRNDHTRYEAVAVALVETRSDRLGDVFSSYPGSASPLALDRFLPTLYDVYDLRYPYMLGPAVPAVRRLQWASESPALLAIEQAGCSQDALGYAPRIADQ